MKIRTYKKTDIEKVAKIYNETTLEYNWEDLTDEQKKVILFKDLEKVHELLKLPNITLVLEESGGIAGFVMMKSGGYINFLYVDKDHLGKGYGKKLIQAAEEKARESGLEKTYLHASVYTAKRKIYQKLGYQDLGLEKYEIIGVGFEGHRMEKYFNKKSCS